MPASPLRATSPIALLAAVGLAAGALVSPAVTPAAFAAPTTTIVDSPVDEVIDAAMSPDGTLYAVGGFSEAGPATGGFTRLDSSTAQVDRTFPTVNGRVNSMVVDDSGRIYIGGSFVSVAGQPRSGLARLNSDGSLDTTWAPAVAGFVFGDPVVNSLALSGATLFVGGYFTGVSGAARQNLAAVDTATGDALSWAPNPDNSVSALATDATNLYVGGNFTSPRSRIASYVLADLTLRTGWNPSGANQTVSALAAVDGLVYAGGDFGTIATASRNRLAALDATTGAATSWNPNLNGTVFALVIDDTTAYVGGNFGTVNGGTPRNKVAALRTDDTGTHTAWNPNLGLGGVLYSMAVTDTYVYLGGNFENVNGNPSDGFNRVGRTTGTVDGSWDPGMVTSNSGALVNSLLVQGSSVIVGGGFTHMNVVERNGAAAFDSQTRLTSWNPNINGTPYAIGLSGATAYVVGDFYSVNGSVSRDYAAGIRTDDTGTVTTWDPQPGSYPYDMTIHGNLAYLVGDFGDVGGTTRNYAAAVRIDDTGSLTPWDPDLDSAPYSIALEDGVAYIAGDFNYVNGGSVARYTAAAVSIEDTGTATAWDPDPDSNAYGVAVANGIAYLVGGFGALKYNSTPVIRNYAAAITTEGSGTVTDWDPDFDGSPYDVEISGDYAYLAGDFADLNSGAVQRDGLVAVHLDDTGSASDAWVPLANGGFGYGQPYEGGITVAGSRLLVSGSFPMATLDGLDYPGGLAALPLIPGVSPVPPTPTVPITSGAPRDVQAVAGDKRAEIRWKAPASSGSFPVSYSQVTATPGGRTCLVAAPALTCTVDGLTNGTAYTFSVKALTGAGWSSESDPSNAVVPSASDTRAIVITGSREGKRIVVDGTATGMGMGGILNPWSRLAGQATFTQGSATILVSADGAFEWSRRSGKRISVYVATPDKSLRSNTVMISAR